MDSLIYKRSLFLLVGMLWIFAIGAIIFFVAYFMKAPSSDHEWRWANMTWYSSYPAPGSDECINYNGCEWEGLFAGVDGKQTESWVKAHNIVAVHEKFFDQYNSKWLTIRNLNTGKEMDVQVLDKCADSDCDNCCTKNMQETGFLLDLEKYTAERFNEGISSSTNDTDVIEWKVKR